MKKRRTFKKDDFLVSLLVGIIMFTIVALVFIFTFINSIF